MKRTNPHNLDAEASVLGGVMNRNENLRAIAGLEVQDFYSPKHQAVFGAMRNLEASLTPIDPITLEVELERQGRLDAVGGLAFLGELMLRCPSVDNVAHYAEAIVRLRVTRDLAIRLGEMHDALMDADGRDLEGEAAVQWALSEIKRIDTRGKASSLSIGRVVKDRYVQLQEIEDRRQRGEFALTGVPTGIAKLDEKLGGYPLEIVTLIAGRPRMGKSSVMMAAVQAVTAAGMGAHVFSLEDSRSSYADRAVANVSDIPVSTMRQATMQRAEYELFTRGVSDLARRKAWRYDDKRGRTAPQIVEAWRREGEKNGTKLVVVDYVQRVRPMDPRKPKHEQLEETTACFADAAADDGIAVLLGAQIGRSATQRSGSRPTLEDIKASGALEELAKCAILVHRGSVYGEPVEGVDWDPGWEEPRHRRPFPDEWDERIELIIAKNSNGAEADVWAHWNGPRTRAS